MGTATVTMQSFNFALRQSSADSVDEHRSRYIPSSIYSGPGPSSIYSGPGPAEEYPVPQHPFYLQNETSQISGTSAVNGVHNTYQNTRSISYDRSVRDTRSRNSLPLNVNDPVVMHLLAETALSDSRDYQVVSFEQLEELKRDRKVLRNRIEATKKKIALECKLRDAAQSLNRLYTKPKASIDFNNVDEKGHNRSLNGSKSSDNEALGRANNEYKSSTQRIEELNSDLKNMEIRMEDTQRRILEHTAGILQFTHKGLKKNAKKAEIPRSPESLKGLKGVSSSDHVEDFDERSLYPVPDYVHEFLPSNAVTPILPSSRKFSLDAKLFEEISAQLYDVSSRMHGIIRQLDPTEMLIPPAFPEEETVSQHGNRSTQIEAQLTYITNSLGTLAVAHQRTCEESDNVKSRIHKILEKTESLSRSPMIGHDEPQGEDLASQLAFSTRILEQLHSRVETLVEQKDILTRQIQQQRELNTKSDAQRDAQIQDLTEELEETKKLQAAADQEAQESQNQITLLIEQLDRSKQDIVLVEQQRGMDESKALQAERDARKAAEKQLLEDVEAKQQTNVQLQADIAKMQNEFELRSQQHIQQLNDLTIAKEEASIEAQRHQSEAETLLEQMASLQTELTIVKAELDGAYGTRAQRAADVSLNPAIQKEIDSLSSRNAQLQKELKDTIEDYEQMTKASIDFEKERDRLESSIDILREKCESLESQISEEKLKWLGMKTQAPTETTSTMVLKNEFKKMMRDTRLENMKALRAEQEERRRLEMMIRTMKKEAGLATPAKSVTGSLLSAEAMTPSGS